MSREPGFSDAVPAPPADGRPVHRNTTMADVARVAGVGLKTVSRVVNQEPKVSQEVRDRVLRTIAELGYRPNATARALVTSRTRTIGVVSMSGTYSGPSAILAGVEVAARDAGYSIALTRTPTGQPDAIGEAMDSLVRRGVDGIVILEPADSTRHLGHAIPGTPVLAFEDRVDESADWILVGADDRGGAQEATAHLLSLGHETVVHLAGPRGWRTTETREEGWRAALLEAGRELPAVISGDWSAASGYRAGRLLTQRPGVTAVFAANDDMAIGLIHALERAGRRVPEDVSVVGMDDSEVSAYLHVPLTTVRQDFADIALQGVRRLVDLIEGRPLDARRISIPVHLVERESAAAPGTAASRSRS